MTAIRVIFDGKAFGFANKNQGDLARLFARNGHTVTALDTYYEPTTPRPAGFFSEGRATA